MIEQRKKRKGNRQLLLMLVLIVLVLAVMWSLDRIADPAASATQKTPDVVPAAELTPAVKDAPADSATLVRVGDEAPDFTVELTDGRRTTLSSLRGKVVWLNFWATWCPPCREELKHLASGVLARYTADEAFVFLPVSRGETRETVEEFRRKTGYDFPMGLDPDQAIYGRYARQYIPRNFLIGRDGRIIAATVGFSAEEFAAFTAQLDRALAENE